MLDKSKIKIGDKLRIVGYLSNRYHQTNGIVDVIIPEIECLGEYGAIVKQKGGHDQFITYEDLKLVETSKEIKRISEPTRSKLLEQGSKLGLVFDADYEEWFEQIDLGNNLFVNYGEESDFLKNITFLAKHQSVIGDWYDGEEKPRCMTFEEKDEFLKKYDKQLLWINSNKDINTKPMYCGTKGMSEIYYSNYKVLINDTLIPIPYIQNNKYVDMYGNDWGNKC